MFSWMLFFGGLFAWREASLVNTIDWQSHVCFRGCEPRQGKQEMAEKASQHPTWIRHWTMELIGFDGLQLLNVHQGSIYIWGLLSVVTAMNMLICLLDFSPAILRHPSIYVLARIFFKASIRSISHVLRNKGPFSRILLRGQNIWMPKNAQRKPIWPVAWGSTSSVLFFGWPFYYLDISPQNYYKGCC